MPSTTSDELALPTARDVAEAATLLEGRITRTPTLRVPTLAPSGCERPVQLWLKAENLQRIGAFKARGALNAVLRTPVEARSRGVITYSSGNHAQAVALAAKVTGVPATIAMPEDAPEVKIAGVRRLGASIVIAGTTSEHRRLAALAIAEETGGVIIPPFDDTNIIAGAGTATDELLRAAEREGVDLDAIIVPVGGGGLLAGACTAITRLPEAKRPLIFTVEPNGCDAMMRSLEAGELVDVAPGQTIADGLKPQRVGALTFEIAKRHVNASFLTGDDELERALVRALFEAKLLVEPSGAAALAVALREPGADDDGPRGSPYTRLLAQRTASKQWNVGVLISGGNVSVELVARLVGDEASRHG